MNYTFRNTPLDTMLHPYQVAKALRQYVEFAPRLGLPALWCLSDYFDKSRNRPPSVIAKTRQTYRNLALVCFTSGLLMCFVLSNLLKSAFFPTIFSGLALVVTGAVLYCLGKDKRDTTFDYAARLLVGGLTAQFVAGCETVFTHRGLTQYNQLGEVVSIISYSKCRLFLQTEHLYFVFYDDTQLILQKSDLSDDPHADFIEDVQDMSNKNFITV